MRFYTVVIAALLLVWLYSVVLLSQDEPPTLPVLVIVQTASRPNGVDFVPVLTSTLVLLGFDRVVVHSTDGRELPRLPYGVEVFQPGPIHVVVDASKDKYGDSEERILWRSRIARSMARAYRFAHQAQIPYTLILEDDVQLSSAFYKTVASIVEAPYTGWLAWTLFHAKKFDSRPSYTHGDLFEFKACAQAMLFRTDMLLDLADYVDQHHMEDPGDWLIRNFQFEHRLAMHVAIPSVVQHGGTRTSTRLKRALALQPSDQCWAEDFVR